MSLFFRSTESEYDNGSFENIPVSLVLSVNLCKLVPSLNISTTIIDEKNVTKADGLLLRTLDINIEFLMLKN